MKIKIASLIFIMSFGYAPWAYSQQIDKTIEDCLTALGADVDAAHEAAENIIEYGKISDIGLRSDAEKCIKAAKGKAWSYSVSFGRFLGPEELAIAKKQADLDMKRRIAESNLEDDIEDALVAYKATSHGMIEKETYRVCIALYGDKKSEALLNPVCQASFKQFKHPEMSDEASFVTSVIKEKYPNPSEAERAALTNLGLDP